MDGKWKWVVLVAVYTTNLIASATSFSAGIIYVAILERYGGDSKAKVAAVLSLNCGLLNILGPVTTTIINRYSCRVCLVLGGVFLAISGLLSAFANSVDLLIITYGILGGIGNSLTLVPANLILCFYFREHRNLMIAMSNGVIGLALFLASPMTAYLLDKYALCGTFLIFGALNVHICVAGMVSRPSSLELKAKERKSTKRVQVDEFVYEKRSRIALCKFVSFIRRNVPRVKTAFVFYLLSALAWSFVLSVCIVHLPNFAMINGFGKDDVTLLMTCLSISNTIGRFIPAVTAVNRDFDITLLYAVGLGIMGVVIATFPLFSEYTVGKYVFAACVGLLTGLPNSLMTPITIVIVGLKNLSTAHGFAYFFCGIGIFLGPTVAGLIYGVTDSYKGSFIFAGVISIVGCGFAIAARCTMDKQSSSRSEHFKRPVSAVVVDKNGVLHEVLTKDKHESEVVDKNRILHEPLRKDQHSTGVVLDKNGVLLEPLIKDKPSSEIIVDKKCGLHEPLIKDKPSLEDVIDKHDLLYEPLIKDNPASELIVDTNGGLHERLTKENPAPKSIVDRIGVLHKPIKDNPTLQGVEDTNGFLHEVLPKDRTTCEVVVGNKCDGVLHELLTKDTASKV